MNKYPYMSKIRRGIPKWRKDIENIPFMKDSGIRMNKFAEETFNKGLITEFCFDPLPTIVLCCPWEVDDTKSQMNLVYQWGVVDNTGQTHQHYSAIRSFTDNELNNPTYPKVVNKTWAWNQVFPMFYVNWRCQVYEMTSDYELVPFTDYFYNDTSKNVYIHIDSKNESQRKTWINSCLEYKEKHGCNLYLHIQDWPARSRFEYNTDGFTAVASRDDVPGPVYSSYYIGYGDKNIFGYGVFGDFGYWNPHNKYLGEDGVGFSPMGQSLIYSCLNPRDPNILSDEQIAGDVLGLSDWDFVYGD